jgi:diguanylate cyclase (GGDEF)-like protein
MTSLPPDTEGNAAPPTGAAGRIWSLRREWSRAFAIMVVLLLLASAGTLVGVRHLVGQIGGTARLLDRETSVVTALRSSMVDHEQIAHKLLSDQPIDRAAFVATQARIVDQFAAATKVFPNTDGTRAILQRTEQSWHDGLVAAGLWGAQVQAMQGSHLEENPIFGSASDDARGMLDSLQQPSLSAMRSGLANDAHLERALMAGLAALFGIALAATLYFRRRMTKDLVRPVASMRDGVSKLQDGRYDHRITVARRDELGELAEAFNSMADALHGSHLALTHRATHDSLTGLPNRASLAERLAASFGPVGDRRAYDASVLFIDIDDFKDVNDTLGHEGGDALLIQLTARLSTCIRPEDLVARLGGDEFAIAIVGGARNDTAIDVADRILAALKMPFEVNGASLNVAVSIGIAHRTPDTADAAELLRQADFAMYMAKGGGKGRYQLFDAQMHNNMVGRAALKTDLILAVGSDQLRLEYQPMADLRTGEIVGVEALVRWQHPVFGLLPPGDFIPLAEESGDIDAIGCWVLETAVRQAAAWRRTVANGANLWMSVNLSAFQLPSTRSRAALEAILTDPAVQADRVVLEVTETALVADVAGGIDALNALKLHGVRIAIDDFGTGFSSLSTLSRLPVDILKIDRSFVSGQDSGPPSTPMLQGILALAKTLGLEVIAEGIEQHEQLNLLRTLGFEIGQGFLLARPTSAENIEAMLVKGVISEVAIAAEVNSARELV